MFSNSNSFTSWIEMWSFCWAVRMSLDMFRWSFRWIHRRIIPTCIRTAWSLRWSNWASFSCSISNLGANVLNGYLFSEVLSYVLSIDLFCFFWSILFDEFFYAQVSTTNSYKYSFSFFNFNVNSLLSKLIDSFWFSKEHDVHLLPLRISVDKVS